MKSTLDGSSCNPFSVETSIPQHLKEFLIECIESVSQLELLLIIFKTQNKKWNAAAMAREMRTHPSTALKQMNILSDKGILRKESEDTFIYTPENSELHKKLVDLSELYNERPVAIVTFIYKSPTEKLKGFADAFKFKKD